MNKIKITYDENYQQPVVSSLQVTNDFGKLHKDVLETIRRLTAENSATKNMFFETTYESRGKHYPMYLMNRDGFSLLVMGFTGKDALDWKLKYIQAFNAMEKEINNRIMTPEQIVAQGLLVAQSIIKEREKQIEELKPKAEYYDMIMHNKSLVNITQIAADYGMTANEFNNKLHEMKIQYKLDSQWILYKQYKNCGYTSSETFDFKHRDGTSDVRMHTKWTQKGRLFLYEKLKSEGILPMIERQYNVTEQQTSEVAQA